MTVRFLRLIQSLPIKAYTLKVLLAPNADLAAQILTDNPPALTVEAEYGAWVAEGTRYTAAHHQPIPSKYSGRHIGGARPAPCNDSDIPLLDENEVALISHIDADTIGGLMRAHPDYVSYTTKKYDDFWTYVEYLDTNGWHKADPDYSEHPKISAFASWSQKNRSQIDRQNINDMTLSVMEAMEFMSRILEGDDYALSLGFEYAAKEKELTESSWVRTTPQGLVIRRSNTFVNHLYRDPTGDVGLAVINFNDKDGTITISIAEPIHGISCREIVQSLWGDKAGGHDGIAGSPRGVIMSEEDFLVAINAFERALVKALY